MQTQAVKQLRFFGRHGQGQLRQPLGVRIFPVVGHAGHHLHHGHALQEHGHVFQGGRRRHPLSAQSVHLRHHRGAIGHRQSANQVQHMAAVHTAQHLTHTRLLHQTIAKGNRLVGQAQSIAHRAAGGPGQQTQGQRLGRQLLSAQHTGQVFKHRLGRHGPQVELQAARQHRHRHLLRVGCGQDKFQVLGRLFERLQHSVERRVRQHVHLIDHEDLEAPLHRLVNRLLQQGLHIVDTPVGRCVQLGVIDKPARVDVRTGLAHAAGRGGDAALPVRTLAIERFSQNA